MAQFASGNQEEALDIVQDAMLAFVSKYSDHPESEWMPLFYRVVQSRIIDWQRRSLVRNRLRQWFGHSEDSDEQDENPIDMLVDKKAVSIESKLIGDEFTVSLEAALRNLPLRQRQAFLLRAWEELSTQQTATAMGCSQGSVKTHYSRALHALRTCLEEFQP